MKSHNMPSGQLNAHLEDELVVRVGIPQRSGSIAFHAFAEGYKAMVSASAFWNPLRRQFVIPEASDLYEIDWALDSAGFTAMSQWSRKGTQAGIAGIYPWSLSQYITLASLTSPSWWSQVDFCVEREIASSQSDVDYRVNATVTLLEATLRFIYDWQNELAKSCNSTVVANLLRPPVPILQGYAVGDYLRCLDMMTTVWDRWTPWLAPPKLIGLGSVCRRHLHHPEHGLYPILMGLEGNLPLGSRLHLFGVKGTALNDIKHLNWIASSDSMSWDFSARVKARNSNRSNTIQNRSMEMSRWMTAAAKRIAPACGDQLRLGLSA